MKSVPAGEVTTRNIRALVIPLVLSPLLTGDAVDAQAKETRKKSEPAQKTTLEDPYKELSSPDLSGKLFLAQVRNGLKPGFLHLKWGDPVQKDMVLKQTSGTGLSFFTLSGGEQPGGPCPKPPACQIADHRHLLIRGMLVEPVYVFVMMPLSKQLELAGVRLEGNGSRVRDLLRELQGGRDELSGAWSPSWGMGKKDGNSVNWKSYSEADAETAAVFSQEAPEDGGFLLSIQNERRLRMAGLSPEEAKKRAEEDGEDERLFLASAAGKLWQTHPRWDPRDCKSIADGRIEIGMTAEQVVAARGRPYKVDRTVVGGSTHEQWVMKDSSDSDLLYFEDDTLTVVQRSR